jgi:rfaE bifunctional protein kinase chain/domain
MQDLIARFAGLCVLVVGDVSLDEYIFGRATRLSREAPIPVLEFERREHILGGAANPARNLVALGAGAGQFGVVGDDGEGVQLAALLSSACIDATGVLAVAGRATALKTRVLSQGALRFPQQIARIDRLDRRPLLAADEAALVAAIEAAAPRAQAVICSDYQLGLMTPTLADAVRDLCRRHDMLLAVDAQGSSHLYRGADLFRCNDAEASAALGRPLQTEDDFREGLAELRESLAARAVIVTRGPDGLSLVDESGGYAALPAANRSEVYDTTGAGDTFIAVVTLALTAGAGVHEAAGLANAAAGLVVRRLGNAVVSPEELIEAVSGL